MLPRARPLLASRAALAATCSARAAWVWLPRRSPCARGPRPRLAARSVLACGPLPVLAERRAAGLAGPRLLAWGLGWPRLRSRSLPCCCTKGGAQAAEGRATAAADAAGYVLGCRRLIGAAAQHTAQIPAAICTTELQHMQREMRRGAGTRGAEVCIRAASSWPGLPSQQRFSACMLTSVLVSRRPLPATLSVKVCPVMML